MIVGVQCRHLVRSHCSFTLLPYLSVSWHRWNVTCLFLESELCRRRGYAWPRVVLLPLTEVAECHCSPCQYHGQQCNTHRPGSKFPLSRHENSQKGPQASLLTRPVSSEKCQVPAPHPQMTEPRSQPGTFLSQGSFPRAHGHLSPESWRIIFIP